MKYIVILIIILMACTSQALDKKEIVLISSYVGLNVLDGIQTAKVLSNDRYLELNPLCRSNASMIVTKSVGTALALICTSKIKGKKLRFISLICMNSLYTCVVVNNYYQMNIRDR